MPVPRHPLRRGGAKEERLHRRVGFERAGVIADLRTNVPETLQRARQGHAVFFGLVRAALGCGGELTLGGSESGEILGIGYRSACRGQRGPRGDE